MELKVRFFLAILLLNGYCKLRDTVDILGTTPDTFEQAVSNAMWRNSFERFLRYLNLNGNEGINNSDKFCKVRPAIDNLSQKFLEHSFNGKNKSIDESVVP